MEEDKKKKEEPKVKKIDFSKLKPEELPTKEITVPFESGEQVVTIHPLNGRGRNAWYGNPKHSRDNVAFEDRAIMLALIYGADLEEDEADFLVKSDYRAARFIGNEIWRFTGSYDKDKELEAKEAEKNSGTAETDTAN